jgi:hypothetical protein
MKKSIFYFVFLVTISIVGCDDAANDHKVNAKDNEPQTEADSLKKAVDDDHIIGMSKMGRLTRAEQTTRRLLDSIEKLPVKARQAAAPFKNKLDSLQKELSYAEMAMEKWMRELKRDSVIDNMNMEERIKYLSSEKLKVSKVKENILKGIQKADSVLNNKF